MTDIDRTPRWIDRASRDALVVVAGLAVVLRVLLIATAPPYGYVWDFYQAGVAALSTQHRLPIAADCWACYHPPLYYLAGWPWFALGTHLAPERDVVAWRMLGGLSIASVAAILYYTVRLLRLVGCRRASLAVGVCLTLSAPILFFSSDAPEADVVVTAVLTGFVFHLTRVFGRAGPIAMRDAAGLAVLAGLAAATKSSGLVALASALVLLALRLRTGPARWQTVKAAAVIGALTAAIGGWKYVDNYRQHGTPFFANGSASEGFSLSGRGHAVAYEFATIRLGALARVFGPAPGQLTDFPVYRSVLTTLHAQVWSDMGVFSIRGRHGSLDAPYPSRRMPPWLPMSVIVLGFVPEALALVGIVASLRRRLLRPLLVFGVLTCLAYTWWFLPQTRWALKTKYILSLLPPAIVYVLVGYAWIARHARPLAAAAAVLLGALIVTAQLYMFLFALSR